VAGRWVSLVSSSNKTDHHDMTEILLKVALTTTEKTQLNLTENKNFKFWIKNNLIFKL
jgi:hypothetical protein